MQNSLNRFSNRVENYAKYRPHYPGAVIDFLKEEKILSNKTIVADIGSGTGISAELFLKNGNFVYAVEPNNEMRKEAEKLLHNYTNFTSINGTAESTNLPDKSVDVIISCQAFHWFDKEKCKVEFNRILKPGGTVVLMWNDRRTTSTPFLVEYEKLLQNFATDYKEVDHKNTDEKVFDAFFGKGNYRKKSFENFYHHDYAALEGRLMSSSYMPDETHQNYHHVIDALKQLFIHYQKNNTVTMEYDTIIFYGKL